MRSVEELRRRNHKQPISKIPLDVLQQAFKMAIHPSPFTNRGQAQKRRTEVSITHVSHTWRSSALACSDLWSTFAHSRWSSKSRVPFDCLSAYLKRSGKRPLDIWIELSSYDMENLGRLFQGCLASWPKTPNVGIVCRSPTI